MSVLQHIQMVLWSFLGIRRSAAAAEELAAARPLLLLVTVVGLAAAFVLGLLAVVSVAVHLGG